MSDPRIPEDGALLRAAFADEPGAAERLLRRLADPVWTVCLRLSRDEAAARAALRSVLAARRAERFRRLRAYDGRGRLASFLVLLAREALAERVRAALAEDARRAWPDFEALFGPDLRRLILGRLPGATHEEARRDAYQDVCLGLIEAGARRLRDFRGQGSFGGFVLQTADRLVLDAGSRGAAIRRIELPAAADDVRESAQAGVAAAAVILRREKYLDRQLIVRFAAMIELVNVRGRSGDLAFALAFVAGLLPGLAWPPLTATGRLEDAGGVGEVEAIAAKLEAAIAVLPAGGMALYPAANEAEVGGEIRARAAAGGVRLLPVFRLEEALRGLGLALSQTWLDCPFRGLEPFGFAHASIFFGREREIDELLALWQRRLDQGQPALLVVGPSGAGKSSLVLAGLLPALCRRGAAAGAPETVVWALLRARDVNLNADPAREREGLAAALRACWCHEGEGGLKPAPEGPPPLDPEGFRAWLAAPRGPGPTRFLLVLDQLEEWFDAPLQPKTLAPLFALLAGLAARGIGLVATLTSVALPALGRHPALASRFGVEGRYALGPSQEAASLAAIIHAPAEAAGLRYEAGLEAEIFAAAGHGGPDVLPLLELLLTELHERRERGGNLLRFADHRAVGGLAGVVSSRAEGVFAACSEVERAMVPELLWKLFTAGTIQPADFPPPSALPGLIAALAGRRLLVAESAQGEAPRLRPAHEALLRHWQRAVAEGAARAADIRL